MLQIGGIIYTPSYDENYEGTLLHASEITQYLCDKLINLPVYIEHDISSPILGRVKSAIMLPDKRIFGVLELDVPFFNDKMRTALSCNNHTGNPIYSGLSLGVDLEIETFNDIRKVKKKTPVEVSIVGTGDRPGTEILFFY